MKTTLSMCSLFLAMTVAFGQRPLGVRPTESGGPLLPEQATFDVTFYDLVLRVDPEKQSIDGAVTVLARIVHPAQYFVLDLDTLFEIASVAELDREGQPKTLGFERRGWRIWIPFGGIRQPGEFVQVRVKYGGKPRVAARPPWVGGFTWSKTPGGEHWIGLSCQNDGADIWWPCKDHPSDRADSVSLHITVPASLYCASNGRLRSISTNWDGTNTYHWFVSTPINNYCVNISIAPYRQIDTLYTSVTGEKVPVSFWVIPEHAAQGQSHLPLFMKDLRFLEQRLGPYPFRADKYGIVETPYLGMEHQSLIAYGNNFMINALGYDWLHFHELSHEWWANLVCNYDWKDFWIHESFATYMEALYCESIAGDTAYHSFMSGIRRRIANVKPVAPLQASTTTEIYFFPPDYTRSDGDVYFKGGWILHTLRYLIGSEAMNRFLRRMAYPDPALESVTDGRQCRYASTDDVRALAEKVSGKKLDWFFRVYLHQPKLPKLLTQRKGNDLTLHWEVPEGLNFPMPVQVRVGKTTTTVDMTTGVGRLRLPGKADPVIDPDRWILKDESK